MLARNSTCSLQDFHVGSSVGSKNLQTAQAAIAKRQQKAFTRQIRRCWRRTSRVVSRTSTWGCLSAPRASRRYICRHEGLTDGTPEGDEEERKEMELDEKMDGLIYSFIVGRLVVAPYFPCAVGGWTWTWTCVCPSGVVGESLLDRWACFDTVLSHGSDTGCPVGLNRYSRKRILLPLFVLSSHCRQWAPHQSIHVGPVWDTRIVFHE
ncbi:hypothetical protein BKA67DRAFT_328620 [Truncatella angustata]|uniref:Uncharacterized protein n=1 Tax=Truncatella angustata TaxID=152316 RepID=A0A9P8UK23_9PEZI|nr:uncharacterized protein BKA67DRAFT_328620 [Truncatella angustata]KAH6653680.1 hypothetical protein BKA67DRAFT_328620 [Truncatella angustata]